MKLTGIIEDVFRGVTIFRGYATLKVLAKYSKSTDYQRDRSDDRVKEIFSYMKNSSFIFFPELIFGWQLDNADAIRKLKEEQDTSVIPIDNNIRIRKAKFKFKSLLPGEELKTKVISIEIPDTFSEKIFNRIDGNHRLSVIDRMSDGLEEVLEDVCNQVVPFCVLIQGTSEEAIKHESAYFYLINSKAKPLTTEENLKAILSSGRFTTTEKKELLSIESDATIESIERLADELNKRNLKVIEQSFNGGVYSISYKICKEIAEPNVDTIISAFSYINDEYFSNGNAPEFAEEYIYTLVKVRVMHRNEYDHFLKWSSSHYLDNTTGVMAETIWTMYEKFILSELKVFIAMPYFRKPNSDERDEDLMNDYRSVYVKCFEDVKKETGKPIHMFPIMDDKGLSEDMIANIMSEIEQSDVFIADITNSNPNVLYELGRAHGLKKNCIIVRSDSDNSTCSDIRNIRHFTYKQNAKSTSLLNEVKKNIVAFIDNTL